MVKYHGRGMAPDVPTARLGRVGFSPSAMCAYRQASVQASAIGIVYN
jgi:hypothetical protein